jgi:putative pyrroloquinoline-quinone binding quinoprotein
MRVVRVSRGTAAWARRGLLAVVLLGAAVIPGRASSQATSQCPGSRCNRAGSVLWQSHLPGSWVAEPGVSGTVPAVGEAYAASAGNIAVVGYGTSVVGYQTLTGKVSWQADLSWLPAGSAIVGVRAWRDVVAVGVSVPGGSAGQDRRELILSAATGVQIRAYPAAYYGGAAWASRSRAVIVGARAVTGYANSGGRTVWQRTTGAPQSWVVSGRYLYMAVARAGSLLSGVITGLRQIDLTTGAERMIPLHGSSAGTLSAVVGGVALLTGGDGLRGYDVLYGRLLWQQPGAVLEFVDQGQDSAYIAIGNSLSELDTTTGKTLGRPAPAIASGLYAIRDGVALGLDEDPGDAWGYDVATGKVVWSTPVKSLPYPHFFVDPSGLGGSAGLGSPVALLATCGAAGGGSPATCLRPELVAIKY